MQTEIIELFGFLKDNRMDVRQLAIQHVAGLTSSKDYHSYFRHNNYAAVQDLMQMISDDPKVAHDAIKALINLSAHEEFVKIMDDEEFLSKILFQTVLPKTILADLFCMLLNNLSKHESIVKKLLPPLEDIELQSAQEPKAPRKTSLLDNLIEVFARGEGKRYNPDAEFHFLSGVISNISTLTQGARFMLGKSNVDGQFRLSKMIAFLGHENLIRRGGVTSVIKNCCFDTSMHEMLLTDPDMNLLPYIMLPLMGPEEYDDDDTDGMPDELQLLEDDKKREPDANIRLILIEVLLLLGSTRKGREILRAKKVYPIVQKLHLWESSEEVQEAIERLVQLLMRDEASEDDDAEAPTKMIKNEAKKSKFEIGIEEVESDDD